jgi:hypothetical protein
VSVDLKYFLLSYPALTVRLFPYSVFCLFVKKYPDFGPIIQDQMLPKRFVEILPSRIDYKWQVHQLLQVQVQSILIRISWGQKVVCYEVREYVMIQYDLKNFRASSPWLTGHLLEIERCNVADWQAMTPPWLQ